GVSSRFRTGSAVDISPLQLTGTDPAQNEAGVDPNRPVLMTFNKNLRPFIFDYFASGNPSSPLSVATRFSGKTMELDPTPFWPPAAQISVTIPRSSRVGSAYSLMDWAGNSLRFDASFSFRTAGIIDTTPPQLESVSPPSGTQV